MRRNGMGMAFRGGGAVRIRGGGDVRLLHAQRVELQGAWHARHERPPACQILCRAARRAGAQRAVHLGNPHKAVDFGIVGLKNEAGNVHVG